MKILHVVPALHKSGGGPSESVPMTAMAQLRAGLDVGIAFYECGEMSEKAKEAERIGVKLIRFRGSRTRFNPVAFSWDLVRRFEDVAKDYDVIHTHVQWMFPIWWAAHVARKLKKPLVMMPRGSFAPARLRESAWKKKLVGWLDRWATRYASAVWATAESEAREIAAYVPGTKVEVFPIGLDVERFQGFKVSRGTGFQGERTLLFLSRISPIKGLDMLAEAWRGVVGGSENNQSRKLPVARMAGLAGAEKKLSEWMGNVTKEALRKELLSLMDEKAREGEYRFRNDEEWKMAVESACAFFEAFSSKIVQMSDGRCVYFTPDDRARDRNGGDLTRCWAEYVFHAVSSSGTMLKGKAYRERLYNSSKVGCAKFIERILLDEHCMYRTIDAHPENDAVIFLGQDLSGGRIEIITRLDEYGNARVNLGEVTVIVQHARKQTPPPRYRPLTEVVEAVAKHQAAGFSPSTTDTNISNTSDPCKRGWKLLIVGPDERGYTEKIKRVFAEKCPAGSYEFRGPVYGEEKFKLLASADAFVLPTRNENWGIAVAEAMASGLPVVCTKGAPWPCLETEMAGWWTDVSVDGLERALRDMMSLDDGELRLRGQRARRWSEANLDWSVIARRMRTSYERIVRHG